MKINTIIQGDAKKELKKLPEQSINMVITSPPYWALRDYEVKGQIGLESTFQEYVDNLCNIFDEVKRVLKKQGTCWVNIGDTYNSSPIGNQVDPKRKTAAGVFSYNHKKNTVKDLPMKCLLQIPSRFAIEMCNRGWILRNEIIWYKPNVMPSSAMDRFTVDFEKLFLFTKSKKYYFETQYEPYALTSDVRYRQALRAGKSYNTKEPYKQNTPFIRGKVEAEIKAHVTNPPRYKRGVGSVVSRGDDADGLVVGGTNPKGRNKRCVWTIPTKPFKGAHFATFPEKLIETPIKAGCPEKGIVLDCFMGAGTTAMVARRLGRNYLGIELNKEYIAIANKRFAQSIFTF